MLFSNRSKALICAILNVFNQYEAWSAQVVNTRKSLNFFRTIFRPLIGGCCLDWVSRKGSFLFIFILMTLWEKFVFVWKDGKLVCFRMENLVLLKHFIQSIPIHYLSVLQTPKLVINKIRKVMITFFWGSNDGKPKQKWCPGRFSASRSGREAWASGSCLRHNLLFIWNSLRIYTMSHFYGLIF